MQNPHNEIVFIYDDELSNCGEEILVIGIINTTFVPDDKFQVFLNGEDIGIADLLAAAPASGGKIFIGSLDPDITYDDSIYFGYTDPNLTVSRFDPSLVNENGNNILNTVTIQSPPPEDSANNAGTIFIAIFKIDEDKHLTLVEKNPIELFHPHGTPKSYEFFVRELEYEPCGGSSSSSPPTTTPEPPTTTESPDDCACLEVGNETPGVYEPPIFTTITTQPPTITTTTPIPVSPLTINITSSSTTRTTTTTTTTTATTTTTTSNPCVDDCVKLKW